MIGNDSKSYLSYLNKLIDHTITLIIIPLIKNLLMLIVLLWLRKLRRFIKLLNSKLELLSIRIFLEKVTLKIGEGNYLLSIVLELILGLIKLMVLTEKNSRSFYVAFNCFCVNHKWGIIQNQTAILEISSK